MSAMIFDVPETQEIDAARPSSLENVAGATTAEGVRSHDIIGKPVISVSNGQKLGVVDDLLIDPATMRVAVVLLSKGGLINREVVAIPVDDVEAWGQNAIMVNSPEAVLRREELIDHENWVSAADKVRSRPLVTVDGTRVGQVDDILIDRDGYVTLYELSEGTKGISSTDKEKRVIPANTTRAIGNDVIVVDPGRSGW